MLEMLCPRAVLWSQHKHIVDVPILPCCAQDVLQLLGTNPLLPPTKPRHSSSEVCCLIAGATEVIKGSGQQQPWEAQWLLRNGCWRVASKTNLTGWSQLVVCGVCLIPGIRARLQGVMGTTESRPEPLIDHLRRAMSQPEEHR